MEPWLRLPKSALFARYQLSNGQELAVVNLHGVNFTVGVEEYEEQMAKLERALATHSGPMILAGDFNSWRQARLDIVEAMTGRLALHEVKLGNDQRIKILGQPLDHMYYRGLALIQAEAPLTDASDHNPIIASFKNQANAIISGQTTITSNQGKAATMIAFARSKSVHAPTAA